MEFVAIWVMVWIGIAAMGLIIVWPIKRGKNG